VLIGEVRVDLEQLAVHILGGVGQALGVDRVLVVLVGQLGGHLHVAAVALGQVGQGVEPAIVGAAIHGAAVDLFVVVAGITVLEHRAAVAAVLEQVRGILGGHVHRAAKTAVAAERRVGAFLHFDALDQLGLDEHRALLVALEAALGGAVDGQRDVFGVTETADVDGLAAGFERTALADPRQRLQQAGDVVGLVAVDVRLAQGRAADGAGVDLIAGADHAQGVQLDRAAAGGLALIGAHDVGAADLDQGERAIVQQGTNRHFRGEVTVERRRLDVLELLFIEQQLDFACCATWLRDVANAWAGSCSVNDCAWALRLKARHVAIRLGRKSRCEAWQGARNMKSPGVAKQPKRCADRTQSGGRRG